VFPDRPSSANEQGDTWLRRWSQGPGGHRGFVRPFDMGLKSTLICEYSQRNPLRSWRKQHTPGCQARKQRLARIDDFGEPSDKSAPVMGCVPH
jgi:hypothetical protein